MPSRSKISAVCIRIPNPVDAAHLVEIANSANPPDVIAASDGDGDRNMILGPGMMVSPGDSLAIIVANATVAPGYRANIAGVARSMPTSRAVDAVAADLKLRCYETPTGWRFFCNLLESGAITFCGEESFGTSSSHTREKDGLWAVLFWLNMVAALEQPIDEIVRRHWQRYGRCYFQRRDYFISDAGNATALIENLAQKLEALAGSAEYGPEIIRAEQFCYTDPVDGSVSRNQGIRIEFADGGRVVLRLSGTGTSGATLRVYLDKTEVTPDRLDLRIGEALAELSVAAAAIAEIERFTGLTAPTAII